MTSSKRAFDIVLWGATGFAGQLVAEYFDDSSRADKLNWAIAGRNKQKLEHLRDTLDASGDQAPDILVGDAFDRDRLIEIAGQTRVICSTVGPYAKFGSDLVAACVEQQTDYCDLTGEIHWIRRMIDEHHDEAEDNGARLVHCCGFDSIPSDVGVYRMQRRARETYGMPCQSIRMMVRGMSGGFSGGTLASMSNVFEEATEDPEVRRILSHPYGLNPAGDQQGPDDDWQKGIRWDENEESWTGPFLMASVNEKIVRRTNAIGGWPYGTGFRYGESVSTGQGFTGWAKAGALSAGLSTFAGALALGPTRAALERLFFPEPGEGPDREAIENGYFSVRFVGTGESSEGDSFTLRQTIRGYRDPGYGATATMLGESAMLLAETNDEGSGRGDEWLKPLNGGVLTPVTAMGSQLIDRLESAGMEFEDSTG